MDAAGTAKVFGALGHEGRLAIFRILAFAGSMGVSAGEIARRTGQMQSTTSANLSVLANAGLVSARRQGRSIFYAVTATRFSRAVAFLMDSSADEQAVRSASSFDPRLDGAADEGDGGLAPRNDLGHDAA